MISPQSKVILVSLIAIQVFKTFWLKNSSLLTRNEILTVSQGTAWGGKKVQDVPVSV